jgi:hypothetical protein
MAIINANHKNIIFIIENEDDEHIQECCNDERNNNTYYLRNKETFKERYVNNIDTKRAYQVEYNLINNDKYNAYQKSYYEQKREKLLEMKKEKVMCDCGKMVSAGHLTCHKKSSIHIKRLQSFKN